MARLDLGKVVPEKGVDYFTPTDKLQIVNDAVQATVAEITPTLNLKADKSEIPDVSNFITASVNNLVNYYLKSETYNKSEVDNLINATKAGIFQLVSVLPTASIDTMNIIYLVPSSDPKTQNIKEEYITILDNDTYSWEHIGSTAISLDGYATEAWVNAQISDFLTDTEIQQLINTAVNVKYTKPSTGIPKNDLASDVQLSLGKADSALQSYTEQYTGTITGIIMNGTSKGTSGVVNLGTVITEHQDISGKVDKTSFVYDDDTATLEITIL